MVQLDTDYYGLSQTSGPARQEPDTHWREPSGNWITSLPEMAAIRSQWRDLEARSTGQMQYFQSFDWCYNWCRQFCASSADRDKPQIRIYTVHKAGKLAMIWPMMQVHDRSNIDKLVFIGEPLTQYGNILSDCRLITAGDVSDAYEKIVETTTADVVALNSFPANSVLGTCRALKGTLRPQAPTSIMDLSGFDDFDALSASLSSSTRRSRNKRRNKLARLGQVEQIEVRGGSSRYMMLVDQVLDWKEIWLAETGRTSAILKLQQTRSFLKSLEDGVVALALTIDGKPVAIEIGFLENRHYYSYIGAFDWAMRDYSPGKVQLEEALRWAIAKGIQSYDLLGNPSSYKAHWSNVEVGLVSHCKALSLKGRLFESVWMPIVRPFLKRTYYRIPVAVRKHVLAPLAGGGRAVET